MLNMEHTLCIGIINVDVIYVKKYIQNMLRNMLGKDRVAGKKNVLVKNIILIK